MSDSAARATLDDALRALETMPAFLDGVLNAADSDALVFSPRAGWFCLVEHACHLRDVEREGYLVRVRRMLAEERPVLAGFEGDVVAQARDYRAQDARAAARDFASARRELIASLREVTLADLRRDAVFAGKTITLTDLVDMIVEHDAEHRRQIGELEAAPGSPLTGAGLETEEL